MDLRKLGGEHTADIDLLPESPLILDVGARGFEYDMELLAIRPKATILAFEPDPSTKPPANDRIMFFPYAITHRQDKTVTWQGEGDGSYIVKPEGPDPGYGWGICKPEVAKEVENIPISMWKHSHFDLVKLDCEGSEFGILENWPGPIATQISIEFHDFCNRVKWNDAYFEWLFADPLHDYRVVQHELLPLGPGPSWGHWDTLLTLR